MEEFYRKLLEAYAKEKGIEDLSRINAEIERIAYHESKGDYSAKQKGGGPGRGGLQFEIGENQGAHTAYNRLQSVSKMYGIDMPTDYDMLKDNNYDVSGLSADAQKAMFLANMRRHPKAKFENVIKGNTKPVDFWGKFHQTKSDPQKMKQFAIDSTYFDKSLQKGEEGLELKKSNSINIANLGTAISSGSQIVGLFSDMIGDIKANKEAIDLKTLKNPYGSFLKDGGTLKDSKNVKTAVGPSHDNAGIKVDENGNPSPFPVAEIEGMEKVVQFKSLPDLKGENYVFPKKIKGQVESIEKKYQDNSKIDQNTKELELKFLKNENEMKKKMKLEKFLKAGGRLPKYENGNPIPDDVNNEISRVMKNHTPSPGIGSINPFLKMESPRLMKQPSMAQEPLPSETKPGASYIDKIKGLAGAKSAVNVAGAIIGTLDDSKIYSNKNLGESENLIRKTLQSDTTEAQRQIDSGLNAAIANLRNSATTGSVFRANAMNAYTKAAGQKAALEESETQRLNTNRVNASNLLFNMGEMESGKLKRASIEDSMNRAALFGQISEAFDNQISVQKLSNNILVARKQSREMMDVLKAQFPNFEPSQEYYDELEATTTPEEVSKAHEKEIIRYKKNNK